MSDMNEVVTRCAPRWAWDIIDETLNLDSKSSSFSIYLRDEITLAMDAVVMSSENPENEKASKREVKIWVHNQR